MARDTRVTSIGEILKAIDQMQPLIDAARQWIDHNRQLPSALVAAMRDDIAKARLPRVVAFARAIGRSRRHDGADLAFIATDCTWNRLPRLAGCWESVLWPRLLVV
jgi:hypothetical protein